MSDEDDESSGGEELEDEVLSDQEDNEKEAEAEAEANPAYEKISTSGTEEEDKPEEEAAAPGAASTEAGDGGVSGGHEEKAEDSSSDPEVYTILGQPRLSDRMAHSPGSTWCYESCLCPAHLSQNVRR